jgi:hypothetical protein
MSNEAKSNRVTDAPRLVGPATVMELLPVKRTAAAAIIRRLGGGKEPGIGLCVSYKRLLEYVRRLEKGQGANSSAERPAEGDTGTPTRSSGTARNASESNVQPGSETTEVRNPDRPQRSSGTKSSAVLHLEAKLLRAQAKRSGKRSVHSRKPKSSRGGPRPT